MKLHELDTLKQQGKAERVLETRLGQTVSFNNLTLRESRHMLLRVRGLINEHRASAASHSSERDPAYLKLLMLESGLKGRLKEVAPVVPGQPAVGAVPGQPAAGTTPATGTVAAKPGQPVAAPVNLKDPKLVAATKKAQSGQQLNPQEKEMMASAGAAAVAMQKESIRGRRRLGESEIQQAQVVLAAQDMVDQMQKVIEQISAMQFKDLPALTDSIKNDPNMGQEQATQYQSAASSALTQLLQSVQQGKTALEGAQGTLTGQAPVVPGEEPAADMGVPPEGGDELNPDAGVSPFDNGGEEEGTDELGNATSLGRERRVAEAKKGKKPDFLDVDKDGNKKEPFKKAVADKKKNPFAKKK